MIALIRTRSSPIVDASVIITLTQIIIIIIIIRIIILIIIITFDDCDPNRCPCLFARRLSSVGPESKFVFS